jgi:hypothetical protein
MFLLICCSFPLLVNIAPVSHFQVFIIRMMQDNPVKSCIFKTQIMYSNQVKEVLKRTYNEALYSRSRKNTNKSDIGNLHNIGDYGNKVIVLIQ